MNLRIALKILKSEKALKWLRNLAYYTIIIGGSLVILYIIVHFGRNLESAAGVSVKIPDESQWQIFTRSFTHNLTHPLATLLIQIVTIILATASFSWLCKKIRQPSVIGEIAAGIVLGPSLLGLYFPGITAAIFPPQSLNNLQLLSQIGLILFMFVIGMELDLKVLKNQAREAIVVSHASIIIPFTLGMGMAYFIYSSFAPPGVQFLSFALFLGRSMRITAFPVLARIVQERGIHKTRLGTVIITCAAVDDITAWSLLAVVIALVKAGSFISSLPTIIMAVAYVFIMLKLIKPFLKRVGNLHASRENLGKPVVAIFFLVLILSAYATEIIGIHALFGAFMAGMVMPENQKFKQIFIEKVEDVALVLLLPLFFVYTGLRTQVGLLDDPNLWKICGLIILVAVIGKFAGSAFTAKFVGQNWKDSLTIGALMNTRGLVELVALNIGYDLGVITPEIFTMLVIMALVTTFMTAPSLDIIQKLSGRKARLNNQEMMRMTRFKVLISFARPEMGSVLLRLIHKLSKNSNGNVEISAIHLFPGKLFNKYKMDNYEKESFLPIDAESRKLNRKFMPIFKVSEDIEKDIAEEANRGDYDLLLVGIGHSIFQGSALGKFLGYTTNILNPDWLFDKVSGSEKSLTRYPLDERTRQILMKTKIPVGVLINNGLKDIERILLQVYSSGDRFLIEYARQFISNSGIQVTVVDTAGSVKSSMELKESIRAIEQIAPNHITMITEMNGDQKAVSKNDLMLVSLDGWKKLDNTTDQIPSVLILRK